MELFLQFTIIVVLATVLSLVMRFLKQPLVVGYILAGIIIGPQFLHLVKSTDYIELFSKIGITILLFIVGLNLSPKIIKEVGKVSLLGGLGQIILTAFYGALISMALDMSFIHALYIGICLSFSSTIIILKLLSDKGDLPKLYGKITIGFLLVQDLVAIGLLLVVSSFTDAPHGDSMQMLFLLLGKLFIMGTVIFLISKYVFPKTIQYLAQSQELLFLFSITWGLGLASVFYLLGFSVEVGALLAGISLSVTPFADGIASRLKPLRDFFIILFFILLGSQMMLNTISQIIVPALILSLFVLVGKPFIVFILMNMLGYKTRQGFQVGVALAQVSEFSLILATVGLTVRHLDQTTVSLITLTALISIAGSSYLISYSEFLYVRLEKILKHLEINNSNKNMQSSESQHQLVLFGFDRVGHDFVETFQKLEKDYLVVDYNPDMIADLETAQMPFRYGDVEDREFLQELQLQNIKLCVSTIPNVKVNALLIKYIRAINKKAIIIVRARELEDAKRLYEHGATYVLMPHYLGAKYATHMITRLGLDERQFQEEREKHLIDINKRKN
ncbi:MAG: cation:proton antiporter [Candidatus Levyibacteriota bacterium]